MIDWLASYGPYLSGISAIVIAAFASGHAILYKREVRASAGWVALIVLVPLLGSLLYLLLGINRIRRKAVALRGQLNRYRAPQAVTPVSLETLAERFAPSQAELARLVETISSHGLLPGNTITPLFDGDQAFPSMLEAIATAKSSITLATFIFDNDSKGNEFMAALEHALKRGVEVKVLIDAAGARYSSPPSLPALRERGIEVALFMPIVFARLFHLNLRNHRKLLIIDGAVGFTGGINIRQRHMVAEADGMAAQHVVRDLHFRLEGPVVGQLQEVFAEDWEFATKESLSGEAFFPELEPVGDTSARGISDGPDEDLDRLQWTLLGAIATARQSICIVTPYFLPDNPLISALNVAALRGVEVDILVPQNVNVRLVQWAMWAHFYPVLRHGVRIWLSPPPFDHTKLMIVDGHWTLFGSTNWDPRSLRLNFEFNVEAYDRELATELAEAMKPRFARAHRVTRSEVDARSLPRKLRDGLARLLSPYL